MPLLRLYRALRFYFRLGYSWHLAWHKGSRVIVQHSPKETLKNLRLSRHRNGIAVR
jgi:hypothetical protein